MHKSVISFEINLVQAAVITKFMVLILANIKKWMTKIEVFYQYFYLTENSYKDIPAYLTNFLS